MKNSESASKLDQLISLFNCRVEVGRPAAAPQLKKSSEQRANIDEHQCSYDLGLTTDIGEAGGLLPHLLGRGFYHSAVQYLSPNGLGSLITRLRRSWRIKYGGCPATRLDSENTTRLDKVRSDGHARDRARRLSTGRQ